jgi:hypothetical protein
VKIWSALARKKPNTGEHGSTTVTFAIGPAARCPSCASVNRVAMGGSTSLRLRPCENAAPFPPPPALRDGTAAYTIRIDFH